MADSSDPSDSGYDYQPPLTCIMCGRPLGQLPDDQPDWPTGPMCGDCYQARQMDDEIWWSEDSESSE